MLVDPVEAYAFAALLVLLVLVWGSVDNWDRRPKGVTPLVAVVSCIGMAVVWPVTVWIVTRRVLHGP